MNGKKAAVPKPRILLSFEEAGGGAGLEDEVEAAGGESDWLCGL